MHPTLRIPRRDLRGTLPQGASLGLAASQIPGPSDTQGFPSDQHRACPGSISNADSNSARAGFPSLHPKRAPAGPRSVLAGEGLGILMSWPST